MKNTETIINETRAYQLDRALEVGLDFRTAYYVVFSDYPTLESMEYFMVMGVCAINDSLRSKLMEEIKKLRK